MTDPRGAVPDEPDDERAEQGAPPEHPAFDEPAGDLSFRVGRLQVDIENRWEAASILNDVMTGLWFVAGSILNFFDSMQYWALALYLAGSTQLLARAFFRLQRRIHAARGYSPSRPRIYRPDIDKEEPRGGSR